MYVTVGLKPIDVPHGMLRVPSVLANCYDNHAQPQLHHVIPDELTGGREATEHLLALGHRDIALLGGSEDSPAARLRVQGYRDAHAADDAPIREDRIFMPVGTSTPVTAAP